MKNKITKKITILFLMAFLASTVSFGQTWRSKPHAIKNLADESKVISVQLEDLENTDPSYAKVLLEKQRFIKNMLTALKTDLTVAEAAQRHLPSLEPNTIQPVIRLIDTSFANKSPRAYIREEILFLIAI